MTEVHDFRGSKAGERVIVTTEQGSFAFTKDQEGSALEGWKLAEEMGDVAVKFIVMEPPFMTSSAVVRSGHELAIERNDEPNIIHSLGENPMIVQFSMEHESAVS